MPRPAAKYLRDVILDFLLFGLASLLFVVCVPLNAQERLVITGVTALRQGPGAGFGSAMILRRGMQVIQNSPDLENGYMRVRFESASEIKSGWVAVARLRSTASVPWEARIRAQPDRTPRGYTLYEVNRSRLVRIPATPLQRQVSAVDRTLQLVFPVAGGRISSSYGPRFDPFTRVPAFHYGIDIAAPEGTPIHALAAGRVVFTGTQGGLGRLVVLDHGQNCRTVYAHASAVNVHDGAYVRQGDIIGYVGQTGRATGPHLHLEVRRGARRLKPRLPTASRTKSASPGATAQGSANTPSARIALLNLNSTGIEHEQTERPRPSPCELADE